MLRRFLDWLQGNKPEGGRWMKHDLRTGKVEEVKFSDRCWDCGCTQFYEGPSGGMSTNIQCAKCGSEFNSDPIQGISERIRVAKPATAD